MKKRILFTALVLLLGLSTVHGAPPQGAPTVDDNEAWVPYFPKEINQIKEGKIVVRNFSGTGGKDKSIIVAALIVDVDIVEAYRILRESEKQVEYTKVLQESKVIERYDDYEILYLKIKFLAWNFEYRTLRKWDDEKYRIWWRLDPDYDNDFARFDGYYQLFYMDDDHSLLKYGVDMILKEYLPRSIQQVIIRNDLPQGLEDVRKRINSHGQYRINRGT